ncbi:MAG: dihydroorotase [Myxococcota bacterium]
MAKHLRTSGPFLIKQVRLIDPYAGFDDTVDVVVDSTGVRVANGAVESAETFNGKGLWALPGLVDLQVHFRQPGFEYKETIETGSRAAFAGGITSVVVMPNTQPTLDTPEEVRFESEESERVGGARILVAAAVTPKLSGEGLTDHGALKAAGAVAVTDDGLPVMSDAVMENSLRACAEHDLLFMQHAEDLSMTDHAPMTESDVSRAIGVRGQPAAAEGVMVERDIALAEKTGARYHVLHTTTGRSIEAVRQARGRGLAVTCEVSPHHLLLTYEACRGADPNFKMNPPLRSEDDRRALVQALVDGTASAVATDHAPHSAEEKAKGFTDAPFGVIGLETAFSALMTFVHDGTISDTRAVELMTSGPAQVLKREGRLGTVLGGDAPSDLCLVDPNRRWTVGDETLHGKSRNSSFLGHVFKGKVVATFFGGELRFDDR